MLEKKATEKPRIEVENIIVPYDSNYRRRSLRVKGLVRFSFTYYLFSLAINLSPSITPNFLNIFLFYFFLYLFHLSKRLTKFFC